ncbi:MAG: PadR family transcriptional regulator [bacterium]|nr:PadR family transcriptional regulator [bacterium]
MEYLTRKDELMMLAILRLGDEAYLVKLREYLNENTDKKWSVGNVFVTLERLESMGFISPRIGEPTSKRGGKAIKFYSITKAGIKSLKATKNLQDNMWEGLQDMVFNR